MASFRLERELSIERPIEEVFAFFADPMNLEAITPPWLHFRVLEAPQGSLQEGSQISYRLRLRGIPLRWTSRISRWEPPLAFVDEQIKGPYLSWVHNHWFVERDGAILVRDRVDYAVPGGRLVNLLLVRRELEKIFDYRRQRLEFLLK